MIVILRQLQPHDELASGAVVYYGNLRGKVKKCFPAKGGLAALHTIEITEKRVRTYAVPPKARYKWVSLDKAKEISVNYSALLYEEKQ